MAAEYIIYCDESEEKGRYFSNFYGGALILSENLEAINRTLNKKKVDLNLKNEVKWTRVTENYERKYINLLSAACPRDRCRHCVLCRR
jgi:hypothetical protein